MKPSQEDIAIQVVWGHKTSELIEEIVATWVRHNSLPPNENPRKRATQVVLVARNSRNEIVGITTAVHFHYSKLKNEMYALRGMLIPECRIPGLFIKMMITTITTLEQFTEDLDEPHKPIGVIAEVENPRLISAKFTQTASGMTLIGFSSKDNPVYVRYFKGATY